MRQIKEHNERKNEILDVASDIFIKKGYEKATINDILTTIGIAKGTFYHYFKSKEEVLNSIVERISDNLVEKAENISQDNRLSPLEKLFQIFISLRVDDKKSNEIIDELHKTENALMHQKLLHSMINKIVPILTKVVDEGNSLKVFQAEYPKQYMQFFLTTATTVIDTEIFDMNEQEEEKMFLAMFTILANMLNIESKQILEMGNNYFKRA